MMPRFFVDPPKGDVIVVEGEDARHIARVLRMHEDDALTLCDGAGFDYHCKIVSVTSGEVVASVVQKLPNESEPSFRIRLYQALPKGEKMDFIVQKAVELGVHDIVPVLCERCVSRPNAGAMEKKLMRLQRIALEAAKQSGRGIIPQVLQPEGYRAAILGMKSFSRAILLYERAVTPLSALLAGRGDIALMVGCEGGFTEHEAAVAETEGIAAASLGNRILRCETAPICAISAILYAGGEF